MCSLLILLGFMQKLVVSYKLSFKNFNLKHNSYSSIKAKDKENEKIGLEGL